MEPGQISDPVDVRLDGPLGELVEGKELNEELAGRLAGFFIHTPGACAPELPQSSPRRSPPRSGFVQLRTAAHPAGASLLQSLRPVRRVAELGSLGLRERAMEMRWSLDARAPRSTLGDVLAEVVRIFADVRHEATQLPSGTVFFRAHGHREHGVTYFPARDSAHCHELIIHMEHPDPSLVQLAALVRRAFGPHNPAFDSSFPSREAGWAVKLIDAAKP